jgi:TatD DNase family protein
MELIDTHCHLTFDELSCQLEDVLSRARDQGVVQCITVGTDLVHTKQCVELAGRFQGVFASAGLHPHYAKDATVDLMQELKSLAQSSKVVAIGECGLDFHYNLSSDKDQKQVFRDQLKIAQDLKLPVIVHTREAFEDTMTILDEFNGSLKQVVLHCFSGNADQAIQALKRGYFLSFTGVVTFKNAAEIRTAVEAVPLERIMVETDCPYMSPEPVRKQRINEPALMVHTAKYLAKLKQVSLADFAEQVTLNSREFFGLPNNDVL